MARRPTRSKSRARVDEAFLAEQKVAEEAGGSDTKQTEATPKDESEDTKKDPMTSSSDSGERSESEPGGDQSLAPDEGATTFGDGKAWIALDIAEDSKQVTVTALSFAESLD
jgi:hypothetical protein